MPSAIAIIGGGRWSRVWATVLAELAIPFEPIVIVSSANEEGMRRFLEGQPRSRHSFEVVSSLDALLARYPIGAAIVANAARNHVETALALVDRGIDVLVEKPLALSTRDVRSLLERAQLRGARVVPGLQYRFCSYLRRFRDQLQPVANELAGFSLDWADAAAEVRYGEVKRYDKTLDIAQDVMPHVWSILATVFDGSEIVVLSGQPFASGRGATFDVSAGTVAGTVSLERDAAARRRVLTLRTSAGATCSLEFSVEPGSITIDNKTSSGDPNWHGGPRPLATQLGHFIAESTEASRAADLHACLASVACLERASALLAG